MKTGLVLEGGAMRGLFSAGVIDALMEAGVAIDGVVGVSAGAAFGCNVKSRQPGRVIRYNTKLAANWRYCSVWSWLLTGDLFGAEYDYHIVPREIDVFDAETFEANPMEFYAVCTSVDTGEAVYKRLDRVDYDALEWIRASASMPICSRIVHLEGNRLLDGGIADSIPLRFMEAQGYGRNIVVLTQPEGYVKTPNRAMPLMRAWLWRHPRLIETLRRRHEMYNGQTAYVAEAEADGRAFVIRPPEALPIGHLCSDPEVMRRVYNIGRETAERLMADLKRWQKVDRE